MAKLPFMSVVVISYFGESTLGATIDSLLKQTYPRNRFEIIIINDGSTDKTPEVARSYKKEVRFFDRPHKGIAGARNAGLEVCKGDIYVAFDDDCIAEPDWLMELAKGYASDDPAGVGGRIIEPEPVKGITSAYISAGDASLGAQLSTESATHNPVRRLWRYVMHRLHVAAALPDKVVVNELYGATSSFPKIVLKRVGGWHEHMSGIEDRDVSLRIRQTYPKRPFYIMPKSRIYHDRGQTLWEYLLRSYKRGPVNLAFHRKNNLTPPIFPFPFLMLLAAAAACLISPLLLLPTLLIVPQILYFWWSVYALRRRMLRALVFPYVQLTEESLVLAGLLRGYLVLARHRAKGALPTFSKLPRLLGVWLAVILLTLLAITNVSPIIRSAAALPYMLLVPGYFFWNFLSGYNYKVSAFRLLIYSLCLSVLMLMVGGLFVNELYILTGNTAPLTAQPIAYTLGGTTILLATLAFIRNPQRFMAWRWSLHRPQLVVTPGLAAILITCLLPLMASAGAITLNNGGSPALATITLAAIGALVVMVALRSREMGRYYGWILYSIALSILLGTSLRGWNITGHDILQEYQVFQLTLTHAAWHMFYYQDPYMACLSITILPTMIQRLTGITDPYIFKVVFQLIFALIGPLMYNTLKDYVSSRRALLATLVFIFFPTFLTDMMMLNRQEIALFFFAASLYVGLDQSLSRRLASMLGFLFLVGMILSHYSTSYIALAALLLAFFYAFIWRIGLKVLHRKTATNDRNLTHIYRPAVVAAALVVLIVWGSIATQTSTNIYKTLGQIGTTLGQKITASSTLPSPVASSVDHYVKTATQTRLLPAAAYYPPAVTDVYPVQATAERAAPVNSVLSWLHISASTLDGIYSAVRSIYALIIEGFIVLGLALALFLWKRKAQLPGQYVFLGVACLTLIAAQVYLPAAAVNYGLTRAIQQSLLVLALPIVLAGLWLLKVVRVPARLREPLFAVVLVGFFLVLCGVVPAITGGSRPVLPLANDGLYYQVYYTHEEEIAAAKWLDVAPPVGSQVYSDEFMRRKLITYAEIFAQPTLVPAAIPVDSYVTLDYGNMVFGQVPAYDGSNVVYYRPPVDFLAANKELVYSSTNIRIYK